MNKPLKHFIYAMLVCAVAMIISYSLADVVALKHPDNPDAGKIIIFWGGIIYFWIASKWFPSN